MKDIRLIKLLKAFSRDELKTFGKFVESPFSKQGRNTIELYNYLAAIHPDYNSLSKREVFNELFKGETYDERKLQNLIFALTKSAEHFLAFCTLEEDELEFSLTLSKGFLNKKLSDESNRINKEIEKKLKPSFSPNKDYVSKLKRLTYLKFKYYDEKKDFTNIYKSIEGLFEASALQFIFEYMNLLGNMKIATSEHMKKIESKFIQNVLQNIDLDKLVNVIEKDDFENNPYIGLHYYRFKTIENEDDTEYYYLLKDLLFKNLSVLEREEKWFFFVHLANCCSQKIARNIDGFGKEILDVYKSMFENNSYSSSEDQYLDVMIYRNVVLLCNSQKDSKWLHYFLENFTDCLHPEHRDNLKNHARAHLHYIKNELEKSLEYISLISTGFFYSKTDIKNLLLKVYYELNYFEQANYAVDAYKHFLDSNKDIAETFKNPYRNFLKLYEELIKIKSGKKQEEALFIKEKIEKESHNAFKPWLLEKADELIKKVKNCSSVLHTILFYEYCSYFLELL